MSDWTIVRGSPQEPWIDVDHPGCDQGTCWTSGTKEWYNRPYNSR